MSRRTARIEAFADSDPPVAIAANLISAMLAKQPQRIAFAGAAASGKSTVASVIAGTHPDLAKDARWQYHVPIPVYNHADGIKAEVLEWVAKAKSRALIPDERATFVSFCDFLGISPGIVERDLWEVLGEPWEAMNELLETAYERRIPVQEWAGVPANVEIPGKVAFVDRHKPAFRRSLQSYGEAIREISGNREYWAEQTVDRGLAFRICLNADTRFPEEAALLHGAGWTVIHLAADRRTRLDRAPELTEQALDHVSERSIGPEHCDVSIDAARPLGRVVMDVAEWLASRVRPESLAIKE